MWTPFLAVSLLSYFNILSSCEFLHPLLILISQFPGHMAVMANNSPCVVRYFPSLIPQVASATYTEVHW